MPTYVFDSEEHVEDRQTHQTTNSSWESIRDNLSDFAQTTIRAGLYKIEDGSQYRVWTAVVTWDTSILGFDESIISATGRVRPRNPEEDETQLLVGAKAKYDHTEYILGNAVFSNVAEIEEAEIATGRFYVSYEDYVIEDNTEVIFAVWPYSITRNDFTQLFIYPTQLMNPSAPDLASLPVSVNQQFSRTGSLGPRLVVHTMPRSTLSGATNASAQLSDGSTVCVVSNADYETHSWGSYPVYDVLKIDPEGNTTTFERQQESWGIDYLYEHSIPGLVFPPPGLQAMSLAVDGEDNVYVFYFRAYEGLLVVIYNSDGEIMREWAHIGGSNDLEPGAVGGNPPYVNNISAVWCADGEGTNGKGRIFLMASDNGRTSTSWSLHRDYPGRLRYYLYDVDDLLNGNEWDNEIDYGFNPDWSNSISFSVNTTGTGLCLATDVPGGSKVGFANYNRTVEITTTLSNPWLSLAVLDVGGFSVQATPISSLTALTSNNGRGAKILGVGEDSFVLVRQPFETSDLAFSDLQDPATNLQEFPIYEHYFDAVWDGTLVWAYYWNPADNTKLMRRSYNPDTNFLGDEIEVGTFTNPGERTLIRTIHNHLSRPDVVEVHFNRTD